MTTTVIDQYSQKSTFNWSKLPYLMDDNDNRSKTEVITQLHNACGWKKLSDIAIFSMQGVTTSNNI